MNFITKWEGQPIKIRQNHAYAFTLVEMMVSVSILALLMMLVVQVLGSAQKSWKSVSSKVSQFREARQAFNRLTYSLSQATLNNYTIQLYAGGADPILPPSKDLRRPPSGYARYSELQFVCGPTSSVTAGGLTGLNPAIAPGHCIFFQAPLGTSSIYGLPMGLNGCGFFIMYGSDDPYRPDFLNERNHPSSTRYRLWEFRTPVENNTIYDYDPGSTVARQNQSAWLSTAVASSRPVADNIILLVVSPKLAQTDATAGAGNNPFSIAPNYQYNSVPAALVLPQADTDHQLPPLIDVTLVAIDSASADKLLFQQSGEGAPPLEEVLPASKFQNVTEFNTDLNTVEQELKLKGVNYRIFSGTITIRASKWNTNI